MIAGAPLGPDGLAALAAAIAHHGAPGGRLHEPLERAVACVAADLAAILARRPPPATTGSSAPAARFVRRLQRRARTPQGATRPIPDEALARLGRRVADARTFASPPPDLEALGLWVAVWAEPDPGRRRDLVSMAPDARARWVGHAPPPPEAP